MRRALILLVLLAGCGGGTVDEPASSCAPLQVARTPVPLTQPVAGYAGTWVTQGEIVPVSEGRFDSGYTSTAKVIRDDVSGTYRIYYTGGVLEDRRGREMFGLANSVTIGGLLTKYDGNGDRGAILELGDAGRYDYDRQWGMGTVLAEGDVWKMWTIGDGDETVSHVARVGYAVSHDRGLTWEKQYAATATGSVFEDFDGCEIGARGVLAFSVVREPDGFYAWYYTFRSNVIRLAFSADGVNWEKRGAVALSEAVTGLGNVVKDGAVYYLTATKPDFSGVVVFVSTDRINWYRHDEFSGALWMAFPFLFRDAEGNWHLFYTAADKRDDGLSGRIGVATLMR